MVSCGALLQKSSIRPLSGALAEARAQCVLNTALVLRGVFSPHWSVPSNPMESQFSPLHVAVSVIAGSVFVICIQRLRATNVDLM